MANLGKRYWADAALMVLTTLAAVAAPFFVVNWSVGPFLEVAGESARPKMQLWLFLISCQGALWCLCILYLGSTFYKLVKNTTRFWAHFYEASVPFLVPMIAVSIFFFRQRAMRAFPPTVLDGFNIENLPRFGPIGVIVAAFAIWQIYLVRSLFLARMQMQTTHSEKVQSLIETRETIFRLLFVAAVILGLGTLATAALRNAVNADKGLDFLPREYVIIFGAQYSLVLVVLYAPIQVTFSRAAQLLRRKLFEAPPFEIEPLKAWCEARAKFEETVGLSLSEASTLGPPLVTLLPLVTGWIGNLLGGK